MKKSLTGIGLAAMVTAALTAQPVVADDRVVMADALATCVFFAEDPWMLGDRLEEAGWRPIKAEGWMEYAPPPGGEGLYVMTSLEDDAFPRSCTIWAETVELFDAMGMVDAFFNANTQYGTYRTTNEDGCGVWQTGMRLHVTVTSSGNAGLCDDRSTSAIEVVARESTVGNQ